MVAARRHIFKIKSSSPDATKKFANLLSKHIKNRDVILLDGELGAGKTFFAGELVKGLGIEENVISPTFMIVREYQNHFYIYHADLYRITPEQFFQLGYIDVIGSDGVFIVEWGSKIADFLDNYLLIDFEILSLKARFLHISAAGKRGEVLAKKWQKDLF